MTCFKMKFISFIFSVMFLDIATAGLLDTLSDLLVSHDNSPTTSKRPTNNILHNGLLSGLNSNIGNRPRPSLFNVPNTANNVLNGLEQPMTKEEQKAVAAAFPEGVDLLNKLQELNKLKEEGKLSPGSNDSSKKPVAPNINININNNPVSTSSTTQPPKRPDNGKPKPPHNGNAGTDNKTTTDNTNAVDVQDLFFQAQPVVPENEKKNHTIPIYFIE